MNTTLLYNWRNTVGPNDEAVIVGDVALGKIAESLPLVAHMTGSLTLVLGNHDRPFGTKPGTPKFERWYAEYGRYFDDIVYSMDVQIGGHSVHVNHFPYEGDSHGEERFTSYRPVRDGRWLIHGHVHSPLINIGEKMIHVGVDAMWEDYGVPRYHPIPESAIEQFIKEHDNA